MAMMNKMPDWKIKMAKKMAHNQTPPEKALWDEMKNNQMGVPWHKQHPMYGYIADFWCPQAKLIVEADGNQHLKKSAVKHDHRRDKVMKSNGIKTIRFTAQEIKNNLPAVMVMIQVEMQKRL
jgi:imidazole glycerol-phosphate synthase subunit HisF